MPSKINDNDFKQDFHLQSSSTNMIPTLSSSAKNISKVIFNSTSVANPLPLDEKGRSMSNYLIIFNLIHS